MKLSTKFNAVMILLLVTALGIMAWLLIEHQQKAAEEDLIQRTEEILTFGQSCREYVAKTLRPSLQGQTDRFIPEAHSATFVTRGVFNIVREQLPEYSFREASLNPLNPINRADDHEAAVIRRFQDDP